MKWIPLLVIGFTLSPTCFAEADSLDVGEEPSARAVRLNETATREWEAQRQQDEEQAAARRNAISPEERAAIIAEARRQALEEMRDEERMRENERFREWERSHPFSAMMCQGDRSCMR